MDQENGKKLPLYLQIKETIEERIRSGHYQPGSLLQTEMELCAEFDVSRVTIRKALKELTDEGYLERKSGSGTYVRRHRHHPASDSRMLGIIVTKIQVEFMGSIVAGFESTALENGWLTILCSSEDDPDLELRCIEALLKSDVRAIAVAPCHKSRLAEREEQLSAAGIALVLIDRGANLSGSYDFIGSDNFGGAYAAVRHLHNQGFYNSAFLAYRSAISSITERLDGYLQGIQDFGLESTDRIDIGREGHSTFYKNQYRYLIEELRDHIQEMRDQSPFGIVAVNDFIAIECIRILKEEGMEIGRDAAVIGFDNIPEGAYLDPPLTTVVQNARLIGRNAAEICVRRVESPDSPLGHLSIPTQLMLRKSCGE